MHKTLAYTFSRHVKGDALIKEELLTFAVQFKTKTSSLTILSLYRVTSGDFNWFVKRLDAIIQYLHKPICDFLI